MFGLTLDAVWRYVALALLVAPLVLALWVAL